jgi:hypothetical protein
VNHNQGAAPHNIELSHQSVELLPNPAGFVVNGIRVAVSSVDSFLHLKKEELVKRTSASKDDWMERIARQLLAQRW